MIKITPVRQDLSASVWAQLSKTTDKGIKPKARLDEISGIQYAVGGHIDKIIGYIGYPRVSLELPGTVFTYEYDEKDHLHVPFSLPKDVEGKEFGYLQVHNGGICTHVLDIFNSDREVSDRYAIDHRLTLLKEVGLL